MLFRNSPFYSPPCCLARPQSNSRKRSLLSKEVVRGGQDTGGSFSPFLVGSCYQARRAHYNMSAFLPFWGLHISSYQHSEDRSWCEDCQNCWRLLAASNALPGGAVARGCAVDLPALRTHICELITAHGRRQLWLTSRPYRLPTHRRNRPCLLLEDALIRPLVL